MQEEITIMDVRFNNVSMDETVDFVLNNDRKGYICTPNPEMLLECQKNTDFLDILNGSLLNIPDGIGILWAAEQIHNRNSKLKAFTELPFIALAPNRFKKVLQDRVTGTDLVQQICKKAAHSPLKIYFLGAAPGIAEIAAEKLEKKYPGLKICGMYAGSPAPEETQEITNRINIADPDILFVAYGAPKQEIWIKENLHKFPSVKKAIGIGGAFDFIAKKRKRAPEWMQKLGLEWLFRLIQQPSRIKRIFNATIKFPIEVIKILK
jgi:N-acetylglucosaminyldiphosphoundecaprenol N-acetyl-beta-D-mannosaminyltransferase